MDKKYSNLIEKEHINLFCQVLNIKFHNIQDIYINPGRSANNYNFVFKVNNRSYLYRIPGKGTEKFCDRAKEVLAYKTLAPFKITDEIIYLSDKTGIKISKYYEGSKIPTNTNYDELRASMETLKKLHEQKIDFPYTDTLFDRMNRYKTFAHEVR